jgi:hypothetical protein
MHGGSVVWSEVVLKVFQWVSTGRGMENAEYEVRYSWSCAVARLYLVVVDGVVLYGKGEERMGSCMRRVELGGGETLHYILDVNVGAFLG